MKFRTPRDSLFPPGNGTQTFQRLREAPDDVSVGLTFSPVEIDIHNTRSPLLSAPAGLVEDYFAGCSAEYEAIGDITTNLVKIVETSGRLHSLITDKNSSSAFATISLYHSC